jgi:hypothetical protein
MKKIAAFLLLLPLPLLSGCEKRLFHFIVTIDQTAPFVIDQTGAFNQSVPITEQAILSALDVPEGGTITGVDIESLSLRVAVKNGNQATALNVSGTVTENGQTRSMFTNYPVPLVAVNAPFIGLNSLIEDGISSLRRKINGYVKRIDNSSFLITVSGTTVPANARALFDINLKIKATVKYDECLDVPLGSSGDDCPSAQ